jgi:hypothetical protein
VIGLIVTGDCEREGLAGSLERLFPGEQFEVAQQKNSLSSGDLAFGTTPGIRSKADEFAAALVAESDSSHYDFVIGVDDVEIPNAQHPDRIVTMLVEAVRRHVTAHFAHERDRSKTYERLRERVSFHLLAPMVEAYFFADPAALVKAGAVRPSQFRAGQVDVEQFVVEDPDYLRVPYPATAPKEARKKSWARPEHRERHPKAYLKFLCEPDDPLCRARRYRESKGGALALRELAWAPALASPQHGMIARALLDDIANMLDRDRPFLGDTHHATSQPPSSRLLRNV